MRQFTIYDTSSNYQTKHQKFDTPLRRKSYNISPKNTNHYSWIPNNSDKRPISKLNYSGMPSILVKLITISGVVLELH